jgi:hypothetical protein
MTCSPNHSPLRNSIRGERAFDTLSSSALTWRQCGCDPSFIHSHICLIQSALINRAAAEPRSNVRKRSTSDFHVSAPAAGRAHWHLSEAVEPGPLARPFHVQVSDKLVCSAAHCRRAPRRWTTRLAIASAHGSLLSDSTSTSVELNDTTKSHAAHRSVRSRKSVSGVPPNGSRRIAEWHVPVSSRHVVV